MTIQKLSRTGSGVRLVEHYLNDLAAQLHQWQLVGVVKLCDCPDLNHRLTKDQLVQPEYHSDGCRYKVTALDIQEGT